TLYSNAGNLRSTQGAPMASPFPGMDPYLETPSLWRSFHRELIAQLVDSLVPMLPDHLRVHPAGRGHTAESPQRTPEEEATCQEEYIEIREGASGSLVTLIQVVAPSNKESWLGREAYLQVRREGKAQGANLVEVDLVLQGQPTL